MITFSPPSLLPSIFTNTRPVLFLGGSIEMGTATLWQDRVIESLTDEDVCILNPRRDDWDSSWVQDPTLGTPFYEQVNWELDGQDMADILIYYFDANTKSPITLLELGVYIDKNVHVYCPKEFWRYGNVKIVCDRFRIPVYKDEDELIHAIKIQLTTYSKIRRGAVIKNI